MCEAFDNYHQLRKKRNPDIFFFSLFSFSIYLSKYLESMRILLLIAFISLVYASSDYFDLLDNEFEQTEKGTVRKYYIAAEEGIWDYASQTGSVVNVPGKRPKKKKGKYSWY